MKFKFCFFYLSILIFLIAGCEKNKETEDALDIYLESYELKTTLTGDQVKAQLSLGSFFYPEIISLINTVIYGVNIYRVTYNTTFLGNPIIASGLVCIPDSKNAFPVISFQNGTNTCNENAPSLSSGDPVYSLISYMASNGYIFCVPDYIGFGESSEIMHLYMHRESSNKAVTDLIKAMIELTNKAKISASINNNVYLMGYSQGGWATLSFLEDMEENPIEDLTVQAAACGAGSYDLLEMSDYIFAQETYPNPFYLPFFIESRRQNGILNEPLATFFNEPYATLIPGLFDGTQCNNEINFQLNNTVSTFLTPGLITNLDSNPHIAELKSELINNSIEPWHTDASIRFFHSTGDKSVPYAQSESIFNEFELLGVDAELIHIDLLDHNEAILSWGVDAITWLNTLN